MISPLFDPTRIAYPILQPMALILTPPMNTTTFSTSRPAVDSCSWPTEDGLLTDKYIWVTACQSIPEGGNARRTGGQGAFGDTTSCDVCSAILRRAAIRRCYKEKCQFKGSAG